MLPPRIAQADSTIVRPAARVIAAFVALMITLALAALMIISGSTTSQAATTISVSNARQAAVTPMWYPLRKAANIGCAKDNCTSMSNHGYWAIDFLGNEGDPVYAVAAGTAHIGGNPGSGCGKGGLESGKWIWIDHGGGVVTRYHHLDSISIKNGQRVTPLTKIGGLGHSGDKAPCTTNYLHFEIRSDGLTGPRRVLPAMAACIGGSKKIMPNYYGSTSWNSKSLARKRTVASSNSCISADWNKVPARPQVSLHPSNGKLAINWGRTPAGTRQVVVKVERYSTSLHSYGRPFHYAFSGAQSGTTLSKLTNGRAHRIVVSFQNAYGYSAWSSTKTGAPGAAPTKGGSARYLTWPHGKYVHYGWNRSNGNGSVVTRYEIAIRCGNGSSYGAWKKHMMSSTKNTYYNFRGLGKAKKCQVMVHAKNAYGWGAWSSARSVKK